MVSPFQDVLNLRVPSSFLSEVKQPTNLEKLATVWMKLHRSGKASVSDPAKAEKIKALIKSCESLSSIARVAGLNNWRVLIASLSQPVVKGKNVNLIEKWNRQICTLFLSLEKNGYEEPKNIKDLVNGLKKNKSVRGLNLVANIINSGFLPILLFPKTEWSSVEGMDGGLEPVEKEMEERVRILKGASALFNECWKGLKFSKEMGELKTKVEAVIASWLEFETLYESIQTGNPRAFVELRALIEGFSREGFTEAFTELLEKGNLKNSDLPYLGNLLLQIAEGVFNASKREVQLSCEFIKAMEVKINCNSNYFTPLDLFRMWWVKPYIRFDYSATTEARDAINIICTILRSAHIKEGDNIYRSKLDIIEGRLNEIENHEEAKYNLQPFQLMSRMVEGGPFPKILLYWLNNPLSFGNFKINDDKLFEELEDQWRHLIEGLQSVQGESIPVLTKVKINNSTFSLDYHSVLVPSQSKEEKALAVFKKLRVELLYEDLNQCRIKYSEDDLASVALTEYDEARSLYLGPFVKYGEALLDKSKKTQLFVSDLKPVSDVIFNAEEFIQGVLKQHSSRALIHQIQTLADLLTDARFPRAIHRSMARTFEAIIPSKTFHSLQHLAKAEEEKEILSELEKHLQNKFYLDRADAKKIDSYLVLLCKKLQIHPVDSIFSIREVPLREIHPVVKQLRDIFSRAQNKIQLSLPKRLPNEEESSLQKRIVRRNQILHNFPELLSEVEKLIAIAQSEVIPSGLRCELILNSGLLVEGAMKIILSHQAISHSENSSTHKFEQKGAHQRNLVNNHELFEIYQSIQHVFPINNAEKALIKKWSSYALVSRYPYHAGKRNPLLCYVNREGTQDLQGELLRDVESILEMTSKFYNFEGV